MSTTVSSTEESLLYRRKLLNELHKTETIIKQQGRGDQITPLTPEDDEMESLPPQPNATRILGENAQTPPALYAYLDHLLRDVPPRWRTWTIRGIFAFIMITAFSVVISMGTLHVALLIILIQIKCYREIITIGNIAYKSDNLPHFRKLSWYFLFVSNYWLAGESLKERFSFLTNQYHFVRQLVTYHPMISFLLYVAGFAGFVFSLKKTYYLKQFTLFGYVHITLLILVVSSHRMIANMYEGMIWLVLPVSLIICNDIMSYVFGFFFGRTPLTSLSPKKTWEGFLGGAMSTMIFGFILAGILSQYQYFVCPLEYDEGINDFKTSCFPNALFKKTTYEMPMPFSIFKRKMDLYPFQVESLLFSLFASIIGPFGGFFASGLKRAFRIKDFGATIPGHGGFVDRFDCQIPMALFVNAYILSFGFVTTPARLFQLVLTLTPENRVEFLNLLRKHIKDDT